MARKKSSARRKATTRHQVPVFRLPLPGIVRERPLDSFALLFAAAAATAITVNALMLQQLVPGRVQTPPAAAVSAPAPAPRPAAQPPAAAPADAQPARAEEANLLVLEVQTELARRGLYDGPTDGIFGPKTEAAIFDFEIGAGLKPTGRPNPQLVAAMRGNSAPPTASSPRVAAVQRVLDQQGFGPVKADGVVGDATRAAIRRFEASRGMPQRGELTPAVLRALSDVSGVSFD